MDKLIFLLGDQLSPQITSLVGAEKSTSVILMAEVFDETQYVRHHKKKIAFIFSAMRHFAEELRSGGWRVDYVKLDDGGNSGSFSGELERAIRRHKPKRIIVTEASEWRVLEEMRDWEGRFGVPVEMREDER